MKVIFIFIVTERGSIGFSMLIVFLEGFFGIAGFLEVKGGGCFFFGVLGCVIF